MKNKSRIFYTPTEKSKQLDSVLRKVKRQVKNYREAKKTGKLRKVTSADSSSLFNV